MTLYGKRIGCLYKYLRGAGLDNIRCCSNASKLVSPLESSVAVEVAKSKSKLPYISESDPFLEVPQAWVVNFNTISERRLAIIDLHPKIFRVFPRSDILKGNITWQDYYRDITFVKQMSRADMPGGGRKARPQRGTGRARMGSIRAPHIMGGGFVGGFKGPRTKFYMLPDNMRLRGLTIALTIKHIQDDLVIVDRLDSLPTDDPQFLLEMAEVRNWGYSILFVDVEDEVSRNLCLATSDITCLNVIPTYSLNCMSMMKHDTLIMTKRAVEEVQQKLLTAMHRRGSISLLPFNYQELMTVNTDGDEEDDLEGGTPFI